MAEEEKKELSAFDQLIEEMRENNRSTFEIEKDGRNSRRHLLESKKELALQTTALNKIADNIGNMEPPEPPPPPPEPKKDTEGSREDKKLQQAILKGIKGVGSGIKNLAGKFKDNAGFLAGLAGIALAVFDPAKLKEIIDRTVGAIVDAFDIVAAVFSGDFSAALEIFKNNWKDISLLIGGLAILNFSKIAAFIGTIKSGFLAVFGSGGAVATVASFFGVGAGAAFGIIIAAVAGVALVVTSIVKSIKKAFNVFKDTGSAFEALKVFLIELPAQIFGIPFNLLKKAMTFMADLFGLETKYDPDFDFVEMFRNLFNFVIDGVVGFVKGIKDTFIELVENAPEIFATVKDFFKDAFDSMVQKFKNIGLMIKAFGVGAIAAIKAAPGAVLGGEQPMEAFDRAYNDVMAGGTGDGSATVANLEADAATRGEELDTSSRDNKLNGQFVEQAAGPPINLTQIDQSDNSNKNTQVSGSGSGRSKGFGMGTDAAYA